MEEEGMGGVKSEDLFIRLKYIAFCRNYMTPGELEFQDLLIFAKNFLCLRKNVLYYDPIWNTYSDEALLVEFYSVRMHEDADFKKEVEQGFKGESDASQDDLDWFDRRIKEEDDKRAAKLKEEVEFKFNPKDICE